jgi:hypothetical protein
VAYQVPVSSIPLLFDPPFILWMLWLACAMGYRALRVLKASLSDASALEKGVLSTSLGLGFLQYVGYSLGMAGALSPKTVWVSLIILVAVFGYDMIRVALGFVRAIQRLWNYPTPIWIRLGLLALLFPLLIAFILALCPPTDVDGIGYHLTAPKRWLQEGRITYLPTFTYTNSPMGFQMLYLLGLAIWSDTAAKLFNYVAGLLSFLSLYALGRRLKGEYVGFLAASLFLLGLGGILGMLGQFTNSYVDMGLTLQISAAFLSWLLWSRSRSRGWMVCCALCAGFAASFKLTGSFVGLIFATAAMAQHLHEKSNWGKAVGGGTSFLLVSLLPVTPWLIRAWLQTGNPVYPLLSGIFPTRDWSPAAAQQFSDFFKYNNWGTGRLSALTLEERKLIRWTALGIVAAVTGLMLWHIKDRELRTMACVTGTLVFITIWNTGLYLRFFTPLIAITWVLILYWLSPHLDRHHAIPKAAVGVIVLFAFLFVVRQRGAIAPSLSVVLGKSSREEYVVSKIPAARIWFDTRGVVPKGSRILAAGIVPYFYSDYPCYYMTESYFRTGSWEAFLEDLRREKITHLLLTPMYYPDVLPGVQLPNRILYVRLLAEKYGQLIIQVQGDKLYALSDLSTP